MKQPSLISGISGIGTNWSFEFFEPITNPTLLKIQLEQTIQDFNQDYSRFLESSYLGQLNQKYSLDLSDKNELGELIELGLKFGKLTEGVFDFTQGQKLEDIGYDQNYSFRSTAATDKTTYIKTSIKEIIKVKNNTAILKPGYKLDFGGYGKGFLIDKLARLLRQKGYQYFIVNGGGDLYVTSDHEEPLELYLQNPIDTNKALTSITLKNEALCASSPYKRRWKDKRTGQIYSHILASQQGNEIKQLQASFVVTSKSVTADALATAISIDSSPQFIKKLQTELDFKHLFYSEAEHQLVGNITRRTSQ